MSFTAIAHSDRPTQHHESEIRGEAVIGSSTSSEPPLVSQASTVDLVATLDRPEWNPVARNSHAEEPADTKRVVLRLELHSLDALMDIITTVARVGAQTETLVAEKKKLVIGFVARDAVARRLPGLLRELIPVLNVETVSRS